MTLSSGTLQHLRARIKIHAEVYLGGREVVLKAASPENSPERLEEDITLAMVDKVLVQHNVTSVTIDRRPRAVWPCYTFNIDLLIESYRDGNAVILAAPSPKDDPRLAKELEFFSYLKLALRQDLPLIETFECKVGRERTPRTDAIIIPIESTAI
jgi:hypothetical protein